MRWRQLIYRPIRLYIKKYYYVTYFNLSVQGHYILVITSIIKDIKPSNRILLQLNRYT